MNSSERGDTLVETVVAVAITAVAFGALTVGIVGAVRHFGPDPVEAALQAETRRQMRIAVDLAKYQGTTFAPTAIATAIPIPGASPFPAHVSLSVSPTGGGFAIAIRAVSDADSAKSATLSTVVPAPAPLPSSIVTAGGLAPAPAGAQ